jgi:hypothetical protein
MTRLPRRAFLKTAGVAMALPTLTSTLPAAGRDAGVPRRMLAICNNLGLLPERFFPTGSGRTYTDSTYTAILKEFRDHFTVLGGVSHPDVDGGHPADNCFLTAAPHPSSGGFRNTISLDQYIAERIGHQTRFPSLTLGVNCRGAMRSLSWTGAGVLIPTEESPAAIFKKLFIQGSTKEVNAQIDRLQTGRSILDAVADQAKALERNLPGDDKARLDQYFTSVRELESRLKQAGDWERKPKPKATAAAPKDAVNPKEYLAKIRLMYDMARLAFETDSTRCITLMLDSVNSPVIDVPDAMITEAYHNLSHHGKSPNKLAQLQAIDEAHMRLLANLFGDLKSIREGNDTLLDRTMVLYGSNLGNASTHVTTNLPVLLAGGGFAHGQFIDFDRTHNYPLPNLFVSMLQRMGIEADKFASSTGTLRGLSMKG